MITANEYPTTTTANWPSSANAWPGQPGRNRITFTANSTLVHDAPSLLGPVVRTLVAGEEADLGQATTVGGAKWCMVTLRDGKCGYIPAETTVRALKYVRLQDASAEMRSATGALAPIMRRLVRGDGFLLLSTVEGGWVRIRDASGQEGFIDGKVKIESAVAQGANPGSHDMAVGALWCVGGILVTAVTYSAAQGGGHYVIAWGAIVFGAIQFFRGLFRSIF